MAVDGRILIRQTEENFLEEVRYLRYGSRLEEICAIQLMWNGWCFHMRASDMHDAGEIATTGEAEEGSTHKHRFTHVYNPRTSLLLCSDTISVPGEFSRLQACRSPSPGQLDGLVKDVRL